MHTHKLLARKNLRLLGALLFILAMTLAACNAATNDSGVEPAAGEGTEETNSDNEAEHDHEEHMEDMDHEHDPDHDHEEHMEEMDHEHEDSARIDNNGAVIRILGPADGSTFGADEDIIVEVEVEGFTLGEDGSHWHIYIDGASWGMVMGQATAQVLRGVDPGEHELAVYLAGGDHIELADGDAVTVTVEE